MKPTTLILSAAVAVASLMPAAARQTCRQQTPPPSAVTCHIDSIDRRSDLTRVYCTFMGRPHTSDRIDGVTLVTRSSHLPATDIDGVDFKRYFQWEDDGAIALEIDFAPVDKADGTRGWSLIFDTVHGTVTSVTEP